MFNMKKFIYSIHITKHKTGIFLLWPPDTQVNWYVHLEQATQLEEMMQLAQKHYN